MTAQERMEQAAHTAEYYMIRAIAFIDGKFGKGYAQKHRELIAAFIQVCAADFASATSVGR